MKEKLRDLGIKSTELSEYMKISRPTLYKYMGLYESGTYDEVPDKVLRCFKFINKFKHLTKEQIISYVIYEFSDTKTSDKKETLRKYLLNKGENDLKIRLMYQMVSSDFLDPVIPYLLNAAELLDAGNLDEEKLYQVSRLMNLISDITKNKPVTEEELAVTKEMLEEMEYVNQAQ